MVTYRRYQHWTFIMIIKECDFDSHIQQQWNGITLRLCQAWKALKFYSITKIILLQEGVSMKNSITTHSMIAHVQLLIVRSN